LKDENKKLNEDIEIMRRVMVEFDLNTIEEQSKENVNRFILIIYSTWLIN